LETVRIGPPEPEAQPEEVRVEQARRVASPRSIVLGPFDELRSDDHVGHARLEELDGPLVEVGIAEIDLVTEYEFALRGQNPALLGLAVVRLADGEEAERVVVLGKLLGEGTGPVPGAVLGEDDLVAPAERGEPFA